MNIGDLVKDKVINQVGSIVEIGFDNDVDEAYAVLQLLDGSHVLATYEDLELLACSEIGGYNESR